MAQDAAQATEGPETLQYGVKANLVSHAKECLSSLPQLLVCYQGETELIVQRQRAKFDPLMIGFLTVRRVNAAHRADALAAHLRTRSKSPENHLTH